ncbi:MAG: SRPBCC family protein [Sporocytophaga sp.]|uniref:SRPBCC family protein n=1 Tax=Sporocytophaga sp. TaxID=2231183 RepID=UPI001B28885A|nr:SRPBCC family protein [Sporocytophaga sp.]MBO9702095.1 SRPBCC family protein [Sporocytophaga sp.]
MSKETTTPISVTVEALVKAPVEKVWKTWNSPEDITKWCQASDDWHAPYAENDLRKGGKFKTRMAAKDGSFSFDFGGEYTNVETNKVIEYTMGDGRKTKVVFSAQGNETKVVETFDAESQNPVEMQKQGWQAILNNFKKYTESV